MTGDASPSSGGKVYLVGAGPGDPDLLTVRARRIIDTADLVMYDSLVDERVVEGLPAGTTTIDVGKKPGPDGRRTTQAEIERWMVDNARAGRTVARLKGGDPGVFGRGGEEAEHLASENVPFEVVPGVTSAVAAPGVAGIPVTHREHASAMTVITGHEDPTKSESALDWDALAATVSAGGTLLILMGVRRLPENVAVLRDHGVPAETPVAMIEKATWEDEQTVTGTLDSIVTARNEAGIEPPALTVVGDVVESRAQVIDCLDRAGTEPTTSAPTPNERGAFADGGTELAFTDPVTGGSETDDD
jgi:uroporphyrin-III C-methyltransferase